MASLKHLLESPHIEGEIEDDASTLEKYSHDASMFEIRPKAVVFPKNTEDVCKLVGFVAKNKKDYPSLSLTARSAGTCMSGGAVNDSVIVAFERYFNHAGPLKENAMSAEPGVYYRDFEKMTLKKGLIMPSYPASRELCMIGGIVNNDSGGEKTLVYGKTHDYVAGVDVVLADGQLHHFGPISKDELDKKLQDTSFEGKIYQRVYKLMEDNYDLIKSSKPRVSKNSTGYNIFDVWDKKTFDLSKLIVGGQGTLGFVTKADFRLVKLKKHSGMLVIFMKNLDNLGDIIKTSLSENPSSLESFDEHTIFFALRFFPSFLRSLGWKKFIRLAFSLIPDAWMLVKGIPKLIILAEFEGSTDEEVVRKVDALQKKLQGFGVSMERAENERKSDKFWTMRRESFNLLRKNVHDKHTAPFIDDFVVPPENLPEFLPKLKMILDKYELLYTIAGHVGDGNFHIIPLMRLQDEVDRAKIEPVLLQVNELVVQYSGSLSGEHNDGLVRGPFLHQMYSPEIMKIFKEIKDIFDPQNIFNPHKKVTSNWEYSKKHIRRSFQ